MGAHLARAESQIDAIKSEVNKQQRDFERLKKRVAAKQAEKLDGANKSGSRSRMAESLRRASQVNQVLRSERCDGKIRSRESEARRARSSRRAAQIEYEYQDLKEEVQKLEEEKELVDQKLVRAKADLNKCHEKINEIAWGIESL